MEKPISKYRYTIKTEQFSLFINLVYPESTNVDKKDNLERLMRGAVYAYVYACFFSNFHRVTGLHPNTLMDLCSFLYFMRFCILSAGIYISGPRSIAYALYFVRSIAEKNGC